MKNTLLFLLIPFLGYSQIDVTKLSLTSDTTLSYVDTSMWIFYEVQMPRFEKQIRLFQADLVTWRNGQRLVTRSTGSKMWKEFAEEARAEIDSRNAEIKIIQKKLNEVRAYRDAWADYLRSQQALK